MWTKTHTVKFKGINYPVQIWLYETLANESNPEVVRIQSMMNEYFIVEEIFFSSRDAAYDFIKHYPLKLAKAFLIREAYNAEAIH